MNHRKRSIQPRWRRQIVHGVTVNNGVSVPKRRATKPGRISRKNVRDKIRRARRYGCSSSEVQRLVGCVGYVKRLHPTVAARLEASLLNPKGEDRSRINQLPSKEARAAQTKRRSK